MNLLFNIQSSISNFLIKEYPDKAFGIGDVLISANKTQNKGDYTVLLFPIAKKAGISPLQLGERIISYLQIEFNTLTFEIVSGFLNIEMPVSYWHDCLKHLMILDLKNLFAKKDKTVLVEYSSPNTNKPLHLGHIRNILLGWSLSNILDRLGYKVIKTQVVNDRGIAICKSMLAWQKFGNESTPESAGIKGDHFVGDYYVLFERKFKEEYQEFQTSEMGQQIYRENAKADQDFSTFFANYKNTYFNTYSNLGKEAREMLIKWENNDPDVRKLWAKMNDWVLRGFNETYLKLGVNFDKVFFESETYSLGKNVILDNIENGIFYRKEDSSIWINLENRGLDNKLVLRSDGTSVYITQDIGMADIRYKEFHFDSCIYVVADEQDYHFKVLFEICKSLQMPYADGLHHLSYGMVELPSGRMKSREGTVVDADDLVAEVIEEATKNSKERNDLVDLSLHEQAEINKMIGMAALKYHIIKVNPKKKMIFDPKESVDLQGHTGPYIQNAFVRISSVHRKNEETIGKDFSDYRAVNTEEKELLLQLTEYPNVINNAAVNYDPSLIANYAYGLAKGFHKFYHDHSILKAETLEAKSFRLNLSKVVADTLSDAMQLIGIEMPEKM